MGFDNFDRIEDMETVAKKIGRRPNVNEVVDLREQPWHNGGVYLVTGIDSAGKVLLKSYVV